MVKIVVVGVVLALGAVACTGGSRAYYGADDGQTDGHALRADTVPCGAFIP